MYTEMNQTHTSTPTLFWEALKAYIRGRIMAYTISYRKDKANQFLLAGEGKGGTASIPTLPE